MKVFLESTVECTIDGVGLLTPGVPVEVDPEYFQVFHKVTPAQANFPNSIKVVYSTEADEEVSE
jgi:hypothetical protein